MPPRPVPKLELEHEEEPRVVLYSECQAAEEDNPRFSPAPDAHIFESESSEDFCNAAKKLVFEAAPPSRETRELRNTRRAQQEKAQPDVPRNVDEGDASPDAADPEDESVEVASDEERSPRSRRRHARQPDPTRTKHDESSCSEYAPRPKPRPAERRRNLRRRGGGVSFSDTDGPAPRRSSRLKKRRTSNRCHYYEEEDKSPRRRVEKRKRGELFPPSDAYANTELYLCMKKEELVDLIRTRDMEIRTCRTMLYVMGREKETYVQSDEEAQTEKRREIVNEIRAPERDKSHGPGATDIHAELYMVMRKEELAMVVVARDLDLATSRATFRRRKQELDENDSTMAGTNS